MQQKSLLSDLKSSDKYCISPIHDFNTFPTLLLLIYTPVLFMNYADTFGSAQADVYSETNSSTFWKYMLIHLFVHS